MLGAFIGGGEIIFVMLALVVIPLFIALFAFWIWMLVDCIKNEKHQRERTDRVGVGHRPDALAGGDHLLFCGRQPRKLAAQRKGSS